MSSNNQWDIPVSLRENAAGDECWFLPASGKVILGSIGENVQEGMTSAWKSTYNFPLARLAFTLTKSCNLRCSFCYNQFHDQESDLDLEQIERAIDDLANQFPPPPTVGLVFSGGEPLLKKREIIGGIEYAERRFSPLGVPVSTTIYTNGTLDLTDDMMELFHSHFVTVAVSIDGPEHIHNSARIDQRGQGGFARTMAFVRRLQVNGLADRIQARAVISSSDVSPVDVLNTIMAEGITRMHLMPAYGAGKKLISGTALPKWLTCLKMYELLLLRGIIIEVSPFWRIFRKLAYPGRFADSFFPCTAGREMLGVGADGSYCLCHHFSGSDSLLGKIGTGLPTPLLYGPSVPGVDNRTPCRKCCVRYLCGGPCYHREFIGAGPDCLEDCSELVSLHLSTARTYARLLRKVPAVIRTIAWGKTQIPFGIAAGIQQYRWQA